MIKHVVMWNLKDKSRGAELKAAIENLQGKIPGLVSIEAGLNINKSNAAADLVLVSTHTDREALTIYQEHPIHVELKDIIIAAVTSQKVVDYIF